MAWNRSKIENGKRRVENRGKSPILNPRFAFVAVGVMVAAGAFVVARLAVKDGGADDAPAATESPKPIAEVPTNVAPAISDAPAMNVAASLPKKESLEPGTKRRVEWKRPDNWDQLTRAQKTRAQPVARVIKPIGWDDRKLFSHPSDRKIERLMRVQPGRLVLGTITYDERFVADFLESLKTPIEFVDEDTEEDKAIKQAVKDARADLKAAYDRGEDIVEIMNRTEKELHELAAYKIDLRKAIVDYRKSGEHSEQDVKDYIEAANTMLKENGMEPLRLGELWFRKAKCDAVTAIEKED